MRLDLSQLQKVKMGVHTIQAILIFVAACLTIAVLVKDGDTDSRTAWFFGLCFLSIPALIYLVAVPMWSRTRKLAKAYVFFGLDVVYTIFWLSAWASVLSWTNAGVRKGASDKKVSGSDANCTVFGFGEESKCSLSYSSMGVGVAIFLLFIGTSIISWLYIKKQRADPSISPWLASRTSYEPTPGGLESHPSKDPIWNTDTHDIDSNFRRSSGSSSHTERGGDQLQGEHDVLHGTDTDEGHHPGRVWGEGGPYARPDQHLDTSYKGSASPHNYQAPSALSPDDYRADNDSPGAYGQSGRPGRVDFPNAPFGYDGRTGGYSVPSRGDR